MPQYRVVRKEPAEGTRVEKMKRDRGSCRYRFVRSGQIFEMRFLEEDSLLDLVRLQSSVIGTLSEIEIFMPHEEDYLHDALCSKLSVLGVWAGKELVAYSIIRYPARGEGNLGRDLGLGEEDLAKVAHLQALAVHPGFRGRGLQRELARSHLRVLNDTVCEHICSTVSPKNPISLNNILSCGFVVRALLPKFNGWWRYILYRSVSWPADGEKEASLEEGIKISCSDINGQRGLIQMGFEGYRVEWKSNGPELYFRRFTDRIQSPQNQLQ